MLLAATIPGRGSLSLSGSNRRSSFSSECGDGNESIVSGCRENAEIAKKDGDILFHHLFLGLWLEHAAKS
jgi:hypothetical protein